MAIDSRLVSFLTDMSGNIVKNRIIWSV